MSTASRIQGRKDCEELLAELVGDEDYLEGVSRACFERARHLVPNPGLTIPRDYLEWMADEALRLQSYLRATDGPSES